MAIVSDEDIERHPAVLRTIVFASDGSAEARPARLAAADLARRSGAALHLVTAYP